MPLVQLVKWQWLDYTRTHCSRRNLRVHFATGRHGSITCVAGPLPS